MDLRLTDYHFVLPGGQIPAVDESQLLDYVVGSNGTYARGRRPGLEVCMPVSFNLQPIRGLMPVASYAQWGYPRMPVELVEIMLTVSTSVCVNGPREALFHLSFGDVPGCRDHLRCAKGWHVEMPEQEASAERVKPTVTGAGSSTERAVIELHSHHSMRAEFSAEDNEDESQGFRVYAVIGTLFTEPRIRARVGLFGHFFEYPATEFFELPEGLADCVRRPK